MTTSADEHRDAAKESLEDTIRSLGNIVVEKTWGSDSYREEYFQDLEDVYIDLIRLRRKL